MKRLCGVIAAVVALAGFGAPAARAETDSYPSRPIRLVVPFLPGGAADVMARVWARKLSEEIGQAIVIDNIGGAGGTVGTGNVARAPADGYTLLLGVSASHAIAPALYTQLQYDPIKDFEPVGQIATFGNAIIVNPSLPVHDVSELLSWGARNPRDALYGTWGIGSAGHLAMEMVKTQSGVPFVHVPYKGASAVLTDVVGGQVPVGTTGVVEIEPATKSGKVRMIAVAGSKRAPNFPDVPTLAEQGISFSTDSWFAVFAPSQTPAAVLSKLRAEVAKIGTDRELQEKLIELGMSPSNLSVEEFAAVQRKDIDVWSKLVESSGAKAN